MVEPIVDVPTEPIFSLDLGANGGVVAPKSAEDLVRWIQHEIQFWSFAQSSNGNSLGITLRELSTPLRQAAKNAQEAARLTATEGNSKAVAAHIETARQHISSFFLDIRWPHSSTPRAKRVEALRKDSDATAAAFLYAVIDNPQTQRFESNDAHVWRGFLRGMMERDGPATGDPQLAAQRSAFEELQAAMAALLSSKKSELEGLQRHYADSVNMLANRLADQKQSFDNLVSDSKQASDAARSAHDAEMTSLRAAFKHEMKLRAPVGYWQERQAHHESQTGKFMGWTFGSLAGLGLLLIGGAVATALTSSDPSKPDAWKLAVLGLVGVLGVWAVRLVVRVYLSHHHLTTDAAERVTMVKTYLALMADDKLPSDDDRKLVLQPLFRPASDGIVKDEALPHPALEWFTRSGRTG